MNAQAVKQEIEYLFESLPDDPGKIIIAICEPAKPFGHALAKRFKNSMIYILIGDAKDLSLMQEIGEPNKVMVELSKTLRFLGDKHADSIIIRSSGYEGKERLRSMLIESANRLKLNGKVYLVTHKKRGAQGHAEMLKEVFGNHELVNKGGGGIRVLSATKERESEQPALPETTVFEETILGEKYKFHTTQAVFSKNRLDPGTRFFLESLSVDNAKRILDLGCGYGAIGIVLARRFPAAHVTMSDVDLESIGLARINAKENGVEYNTTVILSDGLKQLQNIKFDLVVTHFPLHIPRLELRRILTEARNSLTVNGRLCGVALSAYDVRPTVSAVFGNITTIAETDIQSDSYNYRVICGVKAHANAPRIEEGESH